MPLVLAVVGGCLHCPAWAGAGPRPAARDEPQRRFHLDVLVGVHLPQPARHGEALAAHDPRAGCALAAGHSGHDAGEPIVYRIDVSWLLGVGLVLALLAAALPVQDEPDAPLLSRRTGFGVLGIILCVAAASLVVALN